MEWHNNLWHHYRGCSFDGACLSLSSWLQLSPLWPRVSQGKIGWFGKLTFLPRTKTWPGVHLSEYHLSWARTWAQYLEACGQCSHIIHHRAGMQPGLGYVWWTVIHLSKYSIFPPIMPLHYFRHWWTDRVVTSLSGLIWKIILKLRVIGSFPGCGAETTDPDWDVMTGRMTAPGVSLALALATLIASRYPEIKT